MAKGGLELVRLRNNFYRDNYRRILGALLVLLLANIILLGFAGYLFMTKPQPEYFASTADGRIIPIYPFSQPVMTPSTLLTWANNAAVAANTFGFATYQQDLQRASTYFTPDGWQSFEDALKSARTLDTIQAKQLVSTAVATGSPTIIDQGIINGRYAWKVQMQLLVTYEGAGDQKIQVPQVVTMVITRVSRLNSSQGVAIAQYYASNTATQ